MYCCFQTAFPFASPSAQRVSAPAAEALFLRPRRRDPSLRHRTPYESCEPPSKFLHTVPSPGNLMAPAPANRGPAWAATLLPATDRPALPKNYFHLVSRRRADSLEAGLFGCRSCFLEPWYGVFEADLP